MALSQSNSSSIQQPGERYMLYRRADIKNFLKNRHIVVIGDSGENFISVLCFRFLICFFVSTSVQRGTYKDLVLALQEERLLTPSELKAKVREASLCLQKLLIRWFFSGRR